MISNKLIVNAAITGCVLNKGEHPNLPVTLNEIADCVAEVVDEGASIVHLHARCEDGGASHSAADYMELVKRVRRARPEVVVCVSLSGRHAHQVEQRLAPLDSKPDMASLTLGSMNFPTQASLNDPNTIQQLAHRLQELDVMPELEVFEAGFIHYSKHLIKTGLLKAPHYFNIILGSLGAAPLDLLGLGHMLTLLPPDSIWSVGGIGRFQLPANVMAIAAGGHVRVGMEDNPFLNWETREPATNPQLVRRVVSIARELGREPATPAEVRELLRMRSRVAL
jgi:3-keto-5-aminohexanoate cleavage enzyme